MDLAAIDWRTEPYFSGALASCMLLCMLLPACLFRAPVPPNEPHLARPKPRALPKNLLRKVRNPYKPRPTKRD